MAHSQVGWVQDDLGILQPYFYFPVHVWLGDDNGRGHSPMGSAVGFSTNWMGVGTVGSACRGRWRTALGLHIPRQQQQQKKLRYKFTHQQPPPTTRSWNNKFETALTGCPSPFSQVQKPTWKGSCLLFCPPVKNTPFNAAQNKISRTTKRGKNYNWL